MTARVRRFARRRLPLTLQAEEAECGMACLAMIASYHGHEINLNEIRHRFRISLKGTTLRDLVTFAGVMGLSARGLRLEPAALGKLSCPAILHIDMNHFVVLKEMRGTVAIVHDPAHGVRKFDAAELDRRFTGIALELTPAAGFEPREGEPSATLSSLVGAIPSRGLLVKTLTLSFILQLFVLASPLYVQLVIDRAVTPGDATVLLPLLIGFLLFTLLRGAVIWLRTYVLLAFGGLLNAQLMFNIVRHMFRLPDVWFANRNVAALLSRVTSTQPVKDLITQGFSGAVVDGAMALLTLAAVLAVAPSLGVVMLCGFAAVSIVNWQEARVSAPREQEFIEAQAKAQQELIETVRGITAVKLFRQEDSRDASWTERQIDSINAQYERDSIRGRAEVYRELLQAATLAVVVYIGANQVIAGDMSLGILIAFMTYQQIFVESSSKLLEFAVRFRLLNVHLQRLADITTAQQESFDISIDGSRTLAGAVAGRDLSFSYGDLEPLVFDGLSFEVAAGEFVAITGPSGGGKTTLLKLLVGLVQPTSGLVLYDGTPLQRLGIGTVRDQIGVVMQDDVLMSGSLAQNITFFDPTPDLDWMRECARMAAIDDDIRNFPMGYNTLTGDMGTVLSGGQKQRVLLARALYRRPVVLFMDEGTSNLDSEKEREVNANLKSMSLTRIIIAHRTDTIQAADYILELTPRGLFRRESSEIKLASGAA